MDVESAANSQDSDNNKKSNGHSEGQINGVSNGYSGDSKHHKSSHKDKKDRDRDHKKEHKSSRDKDRDKHSSSKDKERSKDHKSSSRDKDRDRDKDKERDKERDRDKDKDKDRDRDRDKEKSDKDRDRSDRDKDRHKSDKDRHHDDKKSSSSKDHKSSSHSSSRDKDKDKDRDKDRDKDHKSSSSHEKDKDRHKHSSSSKDKEKEKEKDRHGSSKDKDKSKSSSSSSKDKHHSSSSKDKDRDKEKDKDRKDRHDRERDDRSEKREKSKADRSKSSRENENISGKIEAKEEIKEESLDIPENQEDPLAIKDDPDSRDYYENNINNTSAASSCDYSLSQFKDEPDYRHNTSQMNGDGEYYSDEQEAEVKEEDESQSDDDMPLASRTSTPTKRKFEESDDDDVPLMARKKPKKEKKAKKRPAQNYDDEEEEYEEKPKKTKIKKEIKQESGKGDGSSPKKRKKKEEAEQEVWKWLSVYRTNKNVKIPTEWDLYVRSKRHRWEEEKKNDGTKWTFLEHKGPVFAPPYEPLPNDVKFYYDGQEMKLSQDAEEVAGFYARMLEHDYTSKEVFNNNFFKDWRKCMTDAEKAKIKDLKKCNFKPMHAYFMKLSEQNRNRTKEEKEEIKRKNQELLDEYGYCIIDGHKEKIGNFKIEPPGLFRGRGEHPKMGMLKKRVMPEDVSINCSKDSKIPKPPPGHKWKEVRHDPCVTWLASWTENVQNQVKYVMLNPSSKLKGEKDWQKYETARRLAKSIDKIRKEYREDWKSKEMRTRQRAVALYFIDKLALRAGNEKDEDQADTVGCCSLRVEHIQLHEQKDGKDYVVVFDFLGKDSIRYYNEVPVEKRVFKNLQLFIENKSGSDDLFDRLTTADLNKHLNELMEGLTAKVFRTYNASWTLQQQLEELTNPDDSIAEKILSYNRANRAVAILCNHQRSVPKGHQKSMEKLKEKIEQKKEQIAEAEKQVKDAKRSAKGGSVKEQVNYDKKKKLLERLREQLKKLEVQETDRDENKTIALGTSKLNYLDPRISVAWCKKFDVPIEKIYNKTQRDKFRWAIDMADADYVF